MRIPQLGCHVQCEPFTVFDDLLSQFDAKDACILKRLLLEYGIQNGIYILTHILNQKSQSLVDSALNHS